jgi:hypothetical protein
MRDPNVSPENVTIVKDALHKAGIDTSCWPSTTKGTASAMKNQKYIWN